MTTTIDAYFQQQKELTSQLEASFNTGSFQPTVVDMQEDYKNDPQICLSTVAFLPKEITDAITEKIIKPLQAIEPDHYYYAPETMHITVKNIRTIHNPPLFTDADIETAKHILNAVVPSFAPLTYKLEDVLKFPTSLALMAYGETNLQRLVLQLDAELKKNGLPDNKKYLSDTIFWGNVTFCRFTHAPSKAFLDKVAEMRHLNMGMFVAKELQLITCNAGCHPDSKKTLGEFAFKQSV